MFRARSRIDSMICKSTWETDFSNFQVTQRDGSNYERERGCPGPVGRYAIQEYRREERPSYDLIPLWQSVLDCGMNSSVGMGGGYNSKIRAFTSKVRQNRIPLLHMTEKNRWTLSSCSLQFPTCCLSTLFLECLPNLCFDPKHQKV